MSDSLPAAGNDGEARFKWKTLALWSLTFGLVSLTALAVVATITKADTLSVVALALAVLAFVVQIIVFIVQGNAASQQTADTAALNAQTLSALAAIEAKSEGTRETVVKMNERLFEFAFNKASFEAESSATPLPAIKLFKRAKEIIESGNAEGATIGQEPNVNIHLPTSSIKPVVSAHPAPPLLDGPLTSADIDKVEGLVESLDLEKSRLGINSIFRLGQDLLAAEQAGRPEQAGISSLNEELALHQQGLIRRVRVNWSETPLFVLTENGRLVAKALLINPPPPSEKIISWRRYVEDFNARIQKDRMKSRLETEAIPIDE